MTKKSVLYIAIVLMFGTAILVTLGRQLTNSDRVNAVASSIASFEMLPGYQTDYTITLGDYTIAAYKSRDEQSHLAFVQAPTNIIPDDAVLSGYIPNSNRHENWHAASVISTEELMIRDHLATLTISERINGEGQLYRSANLVFQGRQGTALMVMNMPIAQWDMEAVKTFIASIR